MKYENIAKDRDFCKYSRLFLFNMNPKVNEYLSSNPFFKLSEYRDLNGENIDLNLFKINAILSRISMKKGFGISVEENDCKMLNDSLELLNKSKEKDCFHISTESAKAVKQERIKEETGMSPRYNLEENFENYMQENQENIMSYVDLQIDLAKNFENTICSSVPIMQVQNAKFRAMKRKSSVIV